MKKIISLMFFTCLIIAIYQHNESPLEDFDTTTEHIDSGWQTFEKKSDDIVSRPTSQKDIVKAKLPVTKAAPARGPAAIKERELVLPYGKEKPQDFHVINSASADWKKRMAPQLMRFLEDGTKLFVKKEKSMTIVERNYGRHVEQVYIKFETKKGRHYSYHALVDSETGTLLKTWNRTQHEGIGHARVRFRVPSSTP
jgi:hypothetical protein